MRTPRIYYPSPLTAGESIVLDKEISHYLGRVLRLKEGTKITLFNGEGGEYRATLQALQKSSAEAVIHDFIQTQTDSQLAVHLIQGISRGERMQYVIQKAVELGAHTLQPVFTEYCEVKLDKERAEKRQEHWQSIANSACEQCGRSQLMHIHPARKLNDWFSDNPAQNPHNLRLTLDPYAQTRLADIQTTPAEVSLLIGPEGGLSTTEVEQARQYGFIGLKLGPRILRTETATAAALSVINLTWGDFNS